MLKRAIAIIAASFLLIAGLSVISADVQATPDDVDYSFFMPWMLALDHVMQLLTGTSLTPQEFYDSLIDVGASPEDGVAYIVTHGYDNWNETSWYALEYMWTYLRIAYPSGDLTNLSWALMQDWLYSYDAIESSNFYTVFLVQDAVSDLEIITIEELAAIQEGLTNLDGAIADYLLPPESTGYDFGISPGLVMLGILCSGAVGFAFFAYGKKRG